MTFHPRLLVLSGAIGLSLILSACSGDGWFGDDDEDAPLPGERVSVLELQKELEPDKAASAARDFAAPKVWQNEFWPQEGGYPNHAMQNLALSNGALKKVWSADIGEGGSGGQPLTAQPVVVDGKVFTLDTRSSLAAFDAKTGKQLWHVSAAKQGEKDPVISGGIAYAGGVLYVTSGYDELIAVNPVNGDVYWRAKLSSPSRAAPTILDGRVFVTTLSNSLMAFDAAKGALLWEYSGLSENAGLLGAASPAAEGPVVIPAFSSGELYALRVENGAVAWSESLSNVLRLGGLSGLSDIRGLPVIDKNMVFAISFGGRMVALDARTGGRVWTRDIGSSETPFVSGNRVFIISTNNELVALGRDDGAILWVSQLARYKNKTDRTGAIIWTGPLLAGGRLLAFSSDGRAAEVDPANGQLVREWDTGRSQKIAPVVAGGTLYLLSEDGMLTAYR